MKQLYYIAFLLLTLCANAAFNPIQPNTFTTNLQNATFGPATLNGTLTGTFSGNGSGITNLNSFNLISNGANDSPALQAALNYLAPKGGVLNLSNGVYSLLTNIYVPSNVTIEGNGATLKSLVGLTNFMVRIETNSINVRVRNITLDGQNGGISWNDGTHFTWACNFPNWPTSPTLTNCGIGVFSGSVDLYNIRCTGFSGYGILLANTNNELAYQNPVATLNNVTVDNSYIGFWTVGWTLDFGPSSVTGDYNAEYVNVSIKAFNCAFGIGMPAGNCRLSRAMITANQYGLYIGASSGNGAHGEISDNTFNHNGTGMLLSAIASGEEIHNNTFIANNNAEALIDNCIGLRVFDNWFGSVKPVIFTNGCNSAAGMNLFYGNIYGGSFNTFTSTVPTQVYRHYNNVVYTGTGFSNIDNLIPDGNLGNYSLTNGGTIQATNFVGNGGGLINLPAATNVIFQDIDGTVILKSINSFHTLTWAEGSLLWVFTDTVLGTFAGNGSGLTNTSIGTVQPTNSNADIFRSTNAAGLSNGAGMTNNWFQDTNLIMQARSIVSGTTGGTSNLVVTIPNLALAFVNSNTLASAGAQGLAKYTVPGGTTNQYLVTGVIHVTAIVGGTVTAQVTYTDNRGNSSGNIQLLSASAVATGYYVVGPLVVWAKTGDINVGTTVVAGTQTYDASIQILRLGQ